MLGCLPSLCCLLGNSCWEMLKQGGLKVSACVRGGQQQAPSAEWWLPAACECLLYTCFALCRCKRNEVPIEKVFNKSLLSKFLWSMDVEPAFRF
jgi:hypothetical protein